MRWWVFGIVLCGVPGSASGQSLPHGIPNLCDRPTVTAKANGPWTSAATWSTGTVPSADARVEIPAGIQVTYDAVAPDVRLACIWARGSMTFTNGARMRVGTVYVVGGLLQIGTASAPITTLTELIFDGALDTSRDPEQFGVGLLAVSGSVVMHGASKTPYVRVGSEPLAGQPTLALTAPVQNWSPGDRLVVPATTPGRNEWETPAVASVSGSTVTLTAPLQFSHRGGRDVAGALRFLPHVGNLSRTVVIRSANPSGTRGHVLFTGRTGIDIRYARFEDLGRTTIQKLDSREDRRIGTNQIGRYALHLHHHVGPAGLPAGTPQFALIGNAIEGGLKWGITIHNSHYGLAKENVLYNNAGAGILTEDGSETRNVIDGNFIVRSMGTGNDRGDERHHPDWGYEGCGIWLRGPNNFVRNNVVAGANSFGMCYYMLQVDEVRIPNAPGDNPSKVVNPKRQPLLQDENNEYYAVSRGVTVWDLMAACCTDVFEGPESVMRKTTIWGGGSPGFYGYGENRLTFDGWVHLADPAALSDGGNNSMSFYFGDYIARNIIIRNADIQGLRLCFFAPIKAGDTRDIYGNAPGTSLIENSTLRCYWGVMDTTPYGVTGGGAALAPRLITIRNTTFGRVPGGESSPYGPQADVWARFTPNDGTNPNILVSQRIVVENSGGTYEVFALEQASDFVIPKVALTEQVAGLTNQAARERFNTSIRGAVSPCATQIPNVRGFACGIVASRTDQAALPAPAVARSP